MSTTDTERADHLKVLGLSDDEIKVYQHLLRTGPSSITELDEAVPDRAASIDSTLGGLVQAGRARRSGSDHSRFLPVPPDAGLEAMTLRRESELKQARIEVLNAYDEFRRTVHNESTTHLIEVVTGSAIIERIHQIKGGAQREILAIDSPPYYIGGPNQEEINYAGDMRTGGTQGISPGSTFKIFASAVALDKGFGLGSRGGTLWSRGTIDDVVWRRRTDDRTNARATRAWGELSTAWFVVTTSGTCL